MEHRNVQPPVVMGEGLVLEGESAPGDQPEVADAGSPKDRGEGLVVLRSDPYKELWERTWSFIPRLSFTNSHTDASICKHPGCKLRAVYIKDPSTQPAFCSVDHYNRSRSNMCLRCNDKRANRSTLFCSTACLEAAEGNAPRLLEIPSNHFAHKMVHKRFKKTWFNPSIVPRVSHIYKVVLSRELREGYERRSSFKREELRWHGTTRYCTVGDGGNTQLCQIDLCCLCNIIRNSYDCEKCRSSPKRIFSARTSAYSSSYIRNGGPTSTKAMFLNKVCIGMRIGGGSVFTVPDNDAIRPEFLLVYDW